jgi:hypothetical protein
MGCLSPKLVVVVVLNEIAGCGVLEQSLPVLVLLLLLLLEASHLGSHSSLPLRVIM